MLYFTNTRGAVSQLMRMKFGILTELTYVINFAKTVWC